MTASAKQLQTLSIYVPPTIARQAFQNPHWQPGGSWRRFHAATAFADISGFTPLTEKLASGGVRGAEELTAILNQVFETLITTVESYGGHVVKFGGDALSLIWPCAPHETRPAVWQAIEAAFAMQAAMARFAIVNTTQGQFALKMKIGISVGELLEVHAGGVFGRWEYVLAGAPMATMSCAENQAQAGEIVIDETAWQLVEGLELSMTNQTPPPPTNGQPQIYAPPHIFGQLVVPGFYRITHLRGGTIPKPLISPEWSALDLPAADKVAAILSSYIPGAIASLLESGHYDMLAELKPLTICFISFDGLDYSNDPQAGPRLSNFMRDAQEIIYYYEGSVNKLAIGDKGSVLLVLFGAPPFFHEDDEIRAIACMLALCKVAARHQLKAHIGLAAGSVFSGPLGAPQRREYTVIGDTVNLAARLMQKAGDGQVWLDQSLYSQTNRFFEFDDLGQIQVKGKSESRHIYQALHEKEQDQKEAIATYLLTELTGRDKELQIIDQLADKVWTNQSQILLLSGEAGVGKSRLATEIVRRWLERGGVPHSGDCVSYGRQTPYLPWRGILTTILGLSTRLSVEQRLRRVENSLSHLPPPVSATTYVNQNYWLQRAPLLADMMGLEHEDTDLTYNLSEDLRRDNLFATIQAIVLEEARQRPTLILLEDIHWSDELSLDLAAYLAPTITDYPLFLVLVHRPIGTPIPLPYQHLRGISSTTQLLVNELDPEASIKLVQNKLAVKTIPPVLADLIRSKGQGNPFFIEELVNSLLGMAVLKIENQECIISGDLDKLEMPDTVQKVVLARIDRLPEEEKMTLKVAATIGRTFQRDLLETVHPWFTTGSTLEEHLKHLQAEDFTRREASESELDFLFKHVITQEVAYETMLYSQRQYLHATIGAALESRYSGQENKVIDLLAYHYARSNDKHKALSYMHRAGQKALAGYANEAAITYFSEALHIARDDIDNVKVQYDLLTDRERAYNRLGDRAAQAEDLAQMKQLAQGQNHQERLLETGNRQLQLATNLAEYNQAIDIAEVILKLSRRINKPIWEVRILTNLGITYWRQGDYSQTRECMLQALQNSDEAKDEQLRATSLNYLGLVHTQISEYEQARQDYQQALEIYQTIGEKGGEAGCANNLGLLESSLGRYEQAQKYYQQALAICHTAGDRLREGISLNTLGQVNTILGYHSEAQKQLEQSLVIRQSIGDRRGEAFCLHDLGYLYLASGQTQEAANTFQTACDLRHTLGETGNYIASLAAKGEAYLTHNNLAGAYKCLQEAIQNLRDNSGSGEYPTQNIWWTYTQICQTRADLAEAESALLQAYQLVKAKAEQISSSQLRQSYLENVQVNAAIITAMAELK